MDKLSARTEAAIEKLFPDADRETVRSILTDECSDKLPLVGPGNHERIHLAILKISAGDVDKFLEAAQLARRDWRDVLVWAGFGNDLDAHLKWVAKLCSFCEG